MSRLVLSLQWVCQDVSSCTNNDNTNQSMQFGAECYGEMDIDGAKSRGQVTV